MPDILDYAVDTKNGKPCTIVWIQITLVSVTQMYSHVLYIPFQTVIEFMDTFSQHVITPALITRKQALSLSVDPTLSAICFA